MPHAFAPRPSAAPPKRPEDSSSKVTLSGCAPAHIIRNRGCALVQKGAVGTGRALAARACPARSRPPPHTLPRARRLPKALLIQSSRVAQCPSGSEVLHFHRQRHDQRLCPLLRCRGSAGRSVRGLALRFESKRLQQRVRDVARPGPLVEVRVLSVEDVLALAVADGRLERGAEAADVFSHATAVDEGHVPARPASPPLVARREDALVARRVARRQQQLAHPLHLGHKAGASRKRLHLQVEIDPRALGRRGARAVGGTTHCLAVGADRR
mmetsp:Transcript_31919/g.103072  ORF Transcript_31919/g.103072 Transcript_31919/m.103072 type:complete len:269 (-) Transcript_31919:128-934(-)|eukprot:scaffold1658_cov115-Isochrysis_galbana.AAC.20